TITVKDATGKDVQLTEEVALALAKQHAPTTEVVELAKFRELSAKVEAQETQLVELTTANTTLKQQAKERDARERVDKLVRAGKIAPVDRDDTIKLAIDSPAAFDLYEKQMAKRPAVVDYGARRGSGDDTGNATPSDEAMALAKVE